MNRAVLFFCQTLTELDLPYLLENSGNRGFHVWITLSEKLSYRMGFAILQSILEKVDLKFDKDLIGIDLFQNPTPTLRVLEVA